MPASLHIAVIQMRSKADPQSNLDWLADAVGTVAGKGARYVQTPEMTGAVQRDKARLSAVLRAQDDDPVVNLATELARQHQIHLHIGSTAIARADGKVANRSFLFAPDGALTATYDKIHMFDVDLDDGESWRESAVYAPGTSGVVADIGAARLGLSICYDVRFPHLYRDMALAGADILCVPAAFTRQTGEAHWHTLLRARAIENGAFVIAAAQGGDHEDGRETFGHSLVVDPWGRVVAEADHDRPDIVDCVIDLDAVAAARSKIPNLKNARDYTMRETPARAGDAAA